MGPDLNGGIGMTDRPFPSHLKRKAKACTLQLRGTGLQYSTYLPYLTLPYVLKQRTKATPEEHLSIIPDLFL